MNGGDGVVNGGIEGGGASDDSRVLMSFRRSNEEGAGRAIVRIFFGGIARDVEEFQGGEKVGNGSRLRVVERSEAKCYSLGRSGVAERSEAIEDQSSGGRTSGEVTRSEANRYNPG
ncbi:hypothetical protein V8G54_029759 [Vigna mungo]|uniref:Uncharacterized protein n=1 Tax=Vigna mungo TaxID=3915 RepID=A0AAQ3RJG3_VIGMU